MRKPSSELLEILSENLKQLRKDHGLSQEEFAAKCSVHRTYIGSVERRERNVTLSTLELIADALNVEVTTLLTKNQFNDESV